MYVTLAKVLRQEVRLRVLRRPFSTIRSTSTDEVASAIAQTGPRVFVSTFHEPYLNIALEGYIFQRMPSDEDIQQNRLLFYVNNPCVVIGRNQNPWRECNVPLLESLGVPLVRRRSGGGAVVHDNQNVNFSFMTRRTEFTRDGFAQLIVESVNSLPRKVEKMLKPAADTMAADDDPLGEVFGEPPSGAPGIPDVEVSAQGLKVVVDGPRTKLKLNHRFDIVSAETGSKVSGSAYKITRQKAYHHGTMLLNSKLDVLRALLSRDVNRMGVIEGRGVESVKSPVANVGMDKEVFIDTVIKRFIQEYQPTETSDELDDNPLTSGLFDEISGSQGTVPVMYIEKAHLPVEVQKAAEELQTWNWKFAQTPDFTHTLTLESDFGIIDDYILRFSVSKGLLKSVELLNADIDLEAVDKGLAELRDLLKDGHQVRYTSEDVGKFLCQPDIRDGVLRALNGAKKTLPM